jgi:hypothetical protein
MPVSGLPIAGDPETCRFRSETFLLTSRSQLVQVALVLFSFEFAHQVDDLILQSLAFGLWKYSFPKQNLQPIKKGQRLLEATASRGSCSRFANSGPVNLTYSAMSPREQIDRKYRAHVSE